MREIPVDQPSFFDLWNWYRFSVTELAALTNASVVHAMLGNQPVRLEDAKNVLAQLSLLLHKDFPLKNVSVSLMESDTTSHENTTSCTQQEVHEHLSGLNRATFMLADSPSAKRGRDWLIQTHLQWFADHGIAVSQGCRCQWTLSP
jgi:hypothetical protein